MKLDICIPTPRRLAEQQGQIAALEAATPTAHRLIVSGQPASPACNRNFCLWLANSEIILLLDDAVEGFTPGWDARLIQPLLTRPEVCMVSAHPPQPDGSLPPTAIAWRNAGLRFDEHFLGADFVDVDCYLQYRQRDRQRAAWVVAADCRLVQRGTAEQPGGQRPHDLALLRRKWGATPAWTSP